MFLVYFIPVIVISVICGVITQSINENKGYDGGFAWGFWLNIIGIIVVAVRPYNISYSSNTQKSEYSSNLSAMAREATDKKILAEGGWTCPKCKRVNRSYLTTCICGTSLSDPRKWEDVSINEKKPIENSSSSADEISKYKKLLDDGVISEEEFAAKKKQLLGL